MRLALLADGIWPDTIGGMQKHTFYLAKYFALNGIQVDLYYCANDAAIVIKQFSFDETLNIKFFKVEFPVFKVNFPSHYVINSYRYSKRLFRLFSQQPKYDYVYAQGFTGWYFVKRGVQLGSNLHGLEMYQKAFGFKSKLAQLILKIPASTIIKGSAVNFSLGGQLTDILKKQGAKLIKETPIGIGEEWLIRNVHQNDKIEFVFVGRNEKRKGLDQLFQALQNLKTNEYLFHFIGISEHKNAVDMPNVIMHGEIKDVQKIQSILSTCDCLVCPSIAEGMPTVILEAMAMGLAIIATNTGATSLLVSQENGHLIEPGNQQALLKSLYHFTKISPLELNKLKNNSFQKVSEKYIWPISILATINALKA